MSNYSLVSWVQLTVTRLSASERRNRINLFVPAAPVPERLPGVRVSVAGRQRHAHSQSGKKKNAETKGPTVLGMIQNNAGEGLNIVIMNGKTGNITKTGHYNMYNNEVEPLIKFLKSIEDGSVVLIASWDEPSSNLNDEAKKLIADLGSSVVNSLGFRDNWLFVGGKGATVKSNFEKHLKNDPNLNKYEHWPELLELKGCIPKYMN
ncbi:protein FAM3C-like isoform X5 [Sparus aurata]|uniref:protein FAM3C-like isoform X5 n=1 Tax=Sparus aurata TaxID=8175 RepID=UPI0011C0DDA8|nr:protein FAM3C-like isoform X5 [Sparus aurata]